MPVDRVVVNASPLIVLFKSGQADLLPQLFHEILVPHAVWDEVIIGNTDRAAQQLPDADWIQRVDVEISPAIAAWDLGTGESAVSQTQSSSSLSSRASQGRPQLFQAIAHQSVIHPVAAPLFLQQSRFVHHLEVVADGRLRQTERLGQFTDAGFLIGLGGDQAEQLQAGWFAQHAKQGGKLGCVFWLQYAGQQRRAAG